jgi:hypothetical protein
MDNVKIFGARITQNKSKKNKILQNGRTARNFQCFLMKLVKSHKNLRKCYDGVYKIKGEGV